MQDDPNNYYEDERVIGEEGWEDVDGNDVSRAMSQDDVAIAITPSIDEGGTLFTKIEIITCDLIRGGTHIFKRGTKYIIGKFLNRLSNIFVSEVGRVFQVWFLNKFNDLVNDMVINIFSGLMNEEAVNFNLRYIDTVYNYDDVVPMGISLQNKTVNITSNGTMEVEPDFGYQGLGEVEINTNVPSYSQLNIQQVKRYELTSVNTIDRILPDQGYDAMYEVDASVDVSNLLKTLSLNITSSDLINGRVTLFGNIQQPNIGWSSYSINVNVSDVISSKLVIDSCGVGYYSTPTGGNYQTVTVNTSDFSSVNGNSFNVSQQYGYLFSFDVNGVIAIGYVVPNDNNAITFDNSVQKIYYYSLGPAKYIERVNFSGGGHWITQVRGFFNNSNAILGHPILECFSSNVISVSFYEE